MTDKVGIFQVGLVLWGGFGVSLLIALRIAYRARRRAPDELCAVLRFVGWVSVFCGIVVPMVAFAAPLLALFKRNPIVPTFFTVNFVICLAIFFAAMRTRQRLSQNRVLLWAIAMADEHQMPLSSAARTLAWEHSTRFGADCARAADRLDQGAVVEEAVRIEDCGAYLAARIGRQYGRLGKCLKDWLALPTPQSTLLRYNYFAIVLNLLTCIALLIFVQLAPVMVRLRQDFGVQSSDFSISQLGMFVHEHFIWFAPLLAAPLALAAVLALVHLGWLGVYIPDFGLRKLSLPADHARVLRSLALATSVQAPIAEALGLLATVYPKRHMRNRLAIAAGQHALGKPWIDAMTAARMITEAEAGVLRSAERAGNLEWGMKEMADRKSRRLESQLKLLDIILFPTVTLLVAFFVGVLCYAMFAELNILLQVVG